MGDFLFWMPQSTWGMVTKFHRLGILQPTVIHSLPSLKVEESKIKAPADSLYREGLLPASQVPWLVGIGQRPVLSPHSHFLHALLPDPYLSRLPPKCGHFYSMPSRVPLFSSECKFLYKSLSCICGTVTAHYNQAHPKFSTQRHIGVLRSMSCGARICEQALVTEKHEVFSLC